MFNKKYDTAQEILNDPTGGIAKLRKMGITDFALITYVVRVQEGTSEEMALRASFKAALSPQTKFSLSGACWSGIQSGGPNRQRAYAVLEIQIQFVNEMQLWTPRLLAPHPFAGLATSATSPSGRNTMPTRRRLRGC
jgi:hypothetical protein